jgi:hypothetical protein
MDGTAILALEQRPTLPLSTGKQATADKNTSRHEVETITRSLARRIKASKHYTSGLGAQLDIEGKDQEIGQFSDDLVINCASWAYFST